MQLILSSQALPDGSLDELCRAAERRSLSGLELVIGAGHEHRVEAACEATSSGLLEPQSADLPVRWMLMPAAITASQLLYWSRRAHLMRAGLMFRQPVSVSPSGVPMALMHGSDPDAAQRAATWAGFHDAQTCWEVDLGARDTKRVVKVLEITAPYLSHVRMLGAGPETQGEAPGTLGTGGLMSRLALQGYGGTLALVPSGPGQEAAWRTWLFDRRGWGCGTAAQKKAVRAS